MFQDSDPSFVDGLISNWVRSIVWQYELYCKVKREHFFG
jgi:hypothetical protein